MDKKVKNNKGTLNISVFENVATDINKDYYRLITVMINQGLRISELLNLCRND